jgi:dipeptidyl aminopeptidase/acylaminoacyl peptidase
MIQPLRQSCVSLLVVAVGVLALPSELAAQANVSQQGWTPQQVLRTETYVKPPAEVERIVTAPRVDISFTNPSPDHRWFLREPGFDRGDIDEYGKAHVYLGGLQVDTKANRARSLTISTHRGLVLVDARTGATRAIETPKGACISAPTWSPRGTEVAYIANFDDASQLFVADVATGKSTQITKTPLLATLVTTVGWTADGKNLIAVLVPDGRGPAPTHGKNGIEDGPQVRLTESRALPQVVHPSLLEDPHDKALLKYYATGQLALIDVKSKAVRKLGPPEMIRSVDPSPDGQYFRVTTMTEPFSYVVPITDFASTQQIWNNAGIPLVTVATTALREGERQPGGDVGPTARGPAASSDTGRRDVRWHPSITGIVYLQSVFASSDTPARGAGRGRGGQRAGQGTPTSVRIMGWKAPFGPGDMQVLYEGSPRLSAFAFGSDGRTAFVADSGTVIALRTDDPSKRFNLGHGVTIPSGGGFGGGGGRGGAANADSTGGALAVRRTPSGDPVVIVGSDDKSVYLTGTHMPGANWSHQAPRPWVDKLAFETGQRTRVFESPSDAFEEIVAPLDDDYSKFIYTHETPTVIPDAFLRDARTGSNTQLTHNKDVAPEVTGAQGKRFQVTRPRDGFKFWVDLTVPRDWRPGTRLPGIIWFYPREYTTQAEYDRSRFTTNINKFPALEPARPASSVKLWVTQGYALLEPDSPIVGDSGKMNDNYTRDLRENLDAVIDAAVDLGYVDRNRMAVGGHSYGAFSTLNALTLTPFFKAGIAGDGMYNRSLTPFGFQSERRDFFEAQSTYLDMSPFYRADKIHGAILMYHALEDQNVGTAPISSVRMYLALQGLGKPAALYMYPYEDHSDGTYATDLDLWARWIAWFDVYVKGSSVEQRSATPLK